jgi:hypothetical protein
MSGANWWQRGGTLITKKHVLFAKHFATSIITGGTPLIFVDENNNVIRRNIISYANDTNTDISIALLNDEVPSNIKIAKVLPTNHTTYMNMLTGRILCVGLDQEEKALLKIYAGLVSYSPVSGIIYRNILAINLNPASYAPEYSEYSSWTETVIVGDSGNPIFFIIDNELVVLSAWWTDTGGPFITDRYDAVNALIDSLSPNGGYSLTPIDLAEVYAKYS